MGNYELGFNQPWYLLLLLLLPLLWLFSYHSLAGLGRYRMLSAIILRTLVLTLIVLALAEIQTLKRTDRLTVLYLLDQSQSIPPAKREAMIDYAIQDVSRHRNDSRGDKAGVIVFGGEAKIEIPPYDDDLPSIGRLESAFDLKSDSTSLEAALKLARASFPEDSAGRVVIITDGNENRGNSIQVARSLSNDGVGIDVVPVMLEGEGDVTVEKVVLPVDIRKGQNFEARVVIVNHNAPTADNPDGIVRGKLTLFQESQQRRIALTDQDDTPIVELTPGKNVFSYKLKIEHSGVHKYHAEFTPEEEIHDGISQNNQASAFTHVRGKGRVLLVENAEKKGEFDHLVERLRSNKLNMEVDVMTTANLYTDGADLLEYDSIILANVPRAGDDGLGNPTSFSDEQVRILVENTHDLGCGLVMIGGPDSFGSGGWINSELEKAMPVDFQIKSKKIQAVGALVMVMHACEMPEGNHWEKVIANKAIDALGPMDYCGVIEWGGASGRDRWLWKKPNGLDRVFENRKLMKSRIGRMTPGDMQDFQPSMVLALTGFKKVKASVNHMIIISDGDPTAPTAALLKAFKDAKVQISTVAVGTHGPPTQTPMKRIADATGGKFYVVKNAKALPGIYQKEARRVSRPLIFEPPEGVQVLANDVSAVTGITQGIDIESLPPVGGYVLTEIKTNGLVEQVLNASKPTDTANSTLLATWRYGLGRATVFTSDAGAKWTNGWTSAADYDRFFGQMIRHSMRPINENANFMLATERKDGKVRIIVTALDEEDEFLNDLAMNANVVSPGGKKKFPIDLKQTGAGRYVGEFDAEDPGSYLFSVIPGEGYQRLSSGVSVPFSTEFSSRKMNEDIIKRLAGFTPDGGATGKVLVGDLNTNVGGLLETDTFRGDLKKAITIEDFWPIMLVLFAVLFFADVFVRRVQVGFGWIGTSLNWLRSRFSGSESVEQSEPISRLQQKKAEIKRQMEEKRAATRFAPEESGLEPTRRRLEDVVQDVTGSSSSRPQPAPPATKPETASQEDEDSYTARLLAAKRKASKERKQD